MAVLGLLHESPLHGYELRKRLNLLLGWSRLLSYGSLYPALKRMLRAGWITEVTTPPPVSRRQRIVYQITPAGTDFFGSEITEAGPDRVGGRQLQHAVRVLLAHRRRRPAARSSRAAGRGCRSGSTGPSTPRTASDDRYVSELRRHAIESVEREVRGSPS